MVLIRRIEPNNTTDKPIAFARTSVIATQNVITIWAGTTVITETRSNIQRMMNKRKRTISETVAITTVEVNVTKISAL